MAIQRDYICKNSLQFVVDGCRGQAMGQAISALVLAMPSGTQGSRERGAAVLQLLLVNVIKVLNFIVVAIVFVVVRGGSGAAGCLC